MDDTIVLAITSMGEEVEIDLVGDHTTESIMYFNEDANSNDQVAQTMRVQNLVANDDFDQSSPRKICSLADMYETCIVAIIEPVHFSDAQNQLEWCKAMEEEIYTIKKNNTWELVSKTMGKDIIGVKCVYKLKLNSTGDIQQHKAHLVAKGFNQKHGIDFHETFIPTT